MKKETNILSLEGLSIGYNTSILNEIDLSVSKGEIVSVIGKNGIGKSTLLKTIAGLHRKISGNIKLNGFENENIISKEKAKILSFVSTGISKHINIKVRELVALGRFPYTNMFGNLTSKDNSIIDDVLRSTDILKLADKNIYEISEGELQRTMIARALAQDTDLVILDEPTAFLDLPNRYEILYLLKKLSREKNKTIIFSSHDLNISMQIADKVWLMKENSIISGSPEDLIINNEFDDLFVNENLKFVKKTGQYYYQTTPLYTVGLKGDGTEFELTKTALNRIGFEVICNKDYKPNVTIVSSNSDKEWVFEKENNKFVFKSIYELLKNINQLI